MTSSLKGGWSGEDETPIEVSKKWPNSCCIRRCCKVERKGWASSLVVDGGVEGRQQGEMRARKVVCTRQDELLAGRKCLGLAGQIVI
jgi:hypothetical protein